jgi:GT2 family glycosyltransferase
MPTPRRKPPANRVKAEPHGNTSRLPALKHSGAGRSPAVFRHADDIQDLDPVLAPPARRRFASIRGGEVARLRREVADRDRRIAQLERDIGLITNSRTWRAVQLGAKVRRRIAGKPFSAARGEGRPSAPPAFVVPDIDAQYARLLEQRAGRSGPRLETVIGPLISILVPAYNTPQWLLWLLRRSIEAQTYASWEVCVADDGSTDPGVAEFLGGWQAELPERVRFVRLPASQGIATASQAALDMAKGEYIALLDHDDELTPDALAEVARVLSARPDADFIYSDEDKVDENGRLYDPFFKPAWSPELMLSMMYTGHLAVFRRQLALAVGGFRKDFDGSQDYDLVLRMTEQTGNIYHIPRVLYHWRAIGGSAALQREAKDYAFDAARRALEEALLRRGLAGVVERGAVPGQWRVRYAVPDPGEVAILVPTNGAIALLERSVGSVLAKTDYPSFRVVVLDNSVTGIDPASFAFARDPRVSFVRCPFKPFNFALVNNFGIAATDSPLVLFLNDDTEVTEPGWLTAMVEHAQGPEVGAVGARLLYPDGRIQHAGVVLGVGGVAGHSHKYFPADHPGYFSFLNLVRNYSAVTAACLLMRRDVFEKLGGFNDVDLAVAFNDVDLCLRLRRAGYRVVYTPYATLKHHESASRGFDVDSAEVRYMKRTWGRYLERDPYYNPNLSLTREDFSLKTLV